MKIQEKIEQNLFKAINRKEILNLKSSGLDIIRNKERIKVLEWVLSDKIDDLDVI